MSGTATYTSILALLAIGAGGAFTLAPTVETENTPTQQASTSLPVWQIQHPVYGGCALSTRPGIEMTDMKLSASCRNAYPELGDAKFWVRDVANEISIYDDLGQKMMSLRETAKDRYTPLKPSTSLLKLVPPTNS